MNLELDILKKDVAFLKKEINSLKEQIIYQEGRNFFKVQLIFEQQEQFNVSSWLKSFKNVFLCTALYYTFNQYEDTHFKSSLFPELKNYKIDLCIYFSVSSKQLPKQIETYFTSINGQVKIYSYMQQTDFDEKCSKESNLIAFE